MIYLLSLVLILFFSPEAGARGPCVDGTDCYCDCVEDTSGTGTNIGSFASVVCQAKGIPIDSNVIVCADFEDPTFENSDSFENNWRYLYHTGATPCADPANAGAAESGTHACRNILQNPAPECRKQSSGGLRPNSVTTNGGGQFSAYEYNASDNDLNENGGHSTLNGVWDGCQTWGYPMRVGLSGGEAANLNADKLGNVNTTTISVTMMKKFSSNHFIGNQGNILGSNVKGDRYRTFPFQNHIHVPMGGSHGQTSSAEACARGTYPVSNKYPFASLIKAGAGAASINGSTNCCEDSCFSQASGRIGVEYHDRDMIRMMMPSTSHWNPRVAGGVPMSTEDEGIPPLQDGRDEWLCFQWTLENMHTDSMNYYFWINNTKIMQMENMPGANDRGGTGVHPVSFGHSLGWLNNVTSGTGQPKPTNPGPEDFWEVRDNYHLTNSATPATCAQVGFGTALPDPPTVDPGRTEGVELGAGVSISYMLPWTRGPWVW